MIERIDALDDRYYLLAVLRVRAVRIAFAGFVFERTVFVLDAVGLLKEKTAGRHTMLERNRLDAHRAVLEDHGMFARVDRVEDDIVQAIVGMIVQQRLQQFLQVRLRIYMHRLRTFEHTECCQQTDQAKAVVPMQMGDEDIIQAGRMNAQFLHRQHYTLAAVDEERLIAQLDQLSRRRSCFRRLCTPAS